MDAKAVAPVPSPAMVTRGSEVQPEPAVLIVMSVTVPKINWPKSSIESAMLAVAVGSTAQPPEKATVATVYPSPPERTGTL